MVDWEPEIHGDVLYAIKLCVFGVALLASAWILNKIGGSGLLGYLFAGLVFGPKVLDFVPETDALRILGRIGVAFLLMEAGLHLNKHAVKEMGLRALGLTLCGMTAPLFGAILVMYVLGYDDFLQAFGVGACFMPTSVGMSVQILTDFDELDTMAGQMIVVVAMIDDILSLVVLAVIEQLGGHKAIMSSEGNEAILESEPEDTSGEFDVLGVMKPAIASAVFGALLLALALWHHGWMERAEKKYVASQMEQRQKQMDREAMQAFTNELASSDDEDDSQNPARISIRASFRSSTLSRTSSADLGTNPLRAKGNFSDTAPIKVVKKRLSSNKGEGDDGMRVRARTHHPYAFLMTAGSARSELERKRYIESDGQARSVALNPIDTSVSLLCAAGSSHACLCCLSVLNTLHSGAAALHIHSYFQL
jgi:hypothetical protein